MTIDMVEIGKRLKELRKKSGLMQKHIAEYLKVDQSLVARIENGERAISTAVLERLANLYCCPVRTIFSQGSCDTFTHFSFRTERMSMKDLESIAAINTIVLNQMEMDRIAELG